MPSLSFFKHTSAPNFKGLHISYSQIKYVTSWLIIDCTDWGNVSKIEGAHCHPAYIYVALIESWPFRITWLGILCVISLTYNGPCIGVARNVVYEILLRVCVSGCDLLTGITHPTFLFPVTISGESHGSLSSRINQNPESGWSPGLKSCPVVLCPVVERVVLLVWREVLPRAGARES